MNRFELPRMWVRLLSWLLDDEWETAAGDFQEYYAHIAGRTSPARARYEFRRQVLAMIPGRLFRKLSQALLMYRNYFLLGWRHLRKNRVASVINVFGLSIAVACSVVVYLFLQGYMNLGKGYEDGDRIFVVEQVSQEDGIRVVRGTSPTPIGPAVAAGFPEVEQVLRMTGRGGLVRAADNSFEEWITFAEGGFLEMFGIALESGDASLLDTDGIVLSRAAADRHFPGRDPVGQILNITLGYEQILSLTVRAVAEPFPSNAALRFTLLARFERLPDVDPQDWAGEVRATFLKVADPAGRPALEAGLVQFVDRRNASLPDTPIESFRLESVAAPSPDAWLTERRYTQATHPAFVWMLVAIPAFMLALSCFNYVNISLGAASRRLREIGVRKSVGGSRSQLVLQFLAENVVLCLIALGLGLLVAFVFLVPLFNTVFVNQIVFSLSELRGLVLFLGALLAVVAVVSGLYPAVYVSSFGAVRILRGRTGLGGNRWLTKALLTTQFLLAFLTVILSLYLTLNGRHVVQAEWGYDPDGTVVVRLDSEAQYRVMADAAAALSGVEAVAGSSGHVGSSSARSDVVLDGAVSSIPHYRVGPDYLKAVGLELVDGRGFEPDRQADIGASVVVNRAFADRFMKDAASPLLGSTVRVDDTDLSIVGVVEDFKVWFAVQDMPAVFTRTGQEEYRFLSVRSNAGNEAALLSGLRRAWERGFPDVHFDGFIQSEVFDFQYQSYHNVVTAFSYIALLALIIACMGLYGLAAQNASRRMKEVSIRKVLGASVAHIVVLANRGFAVMMTVAGLVAVAITWSALTYGLTLVPIDIIHRPLDVSIYLLAFGLVLATAAVSVGVQARRLVLSEPADELRAD